MFLLFVLIVVGIKGYFVHNDSRSKKLQELLLACYGYEVRQ